MIHTINEHDFRRGFEQLRPENFTHDGLRVLFEYLEEFEESTGWSTARHTPGEQVEFDVIALCCEFTESTIPEILDSYSIPVEPDADGDEKKLAVLEYLEDRSLGVCGETSTGTIVFQNF